MHWRLSRRDGASGFFSLVPVPLVVYKLLEDPQHLGSWECYLRRHRSRHKSREPALDNAA